LPTLRLVFVTDREFFGQHSLAPAISASAAAPPLSKLTPTSSAGDYVVHRNHGVGKFLKLEKLTINNETLFGSAVCGWLTASSGRYSGLCPGFAVSGAQAPELNNMSGKAWKDQESKAIIKKLAVDLLKLYAARSQQTGFAYRDMPWQESTIKATTDPAQGGTGCKDMRAIADGSPRLWRCRLW